MSSRQSPPVCAPPGARHAVKAGSSCSFLSHRHSGQSHLAPAVTSLHSPLILCIFCKNFSAEKCLSAVGAGRHRPNSMTRARLARPGQQASEPRHWALSWRGHPFRVRSFGSGMSRFWLSCMSHVSVCTPVHRVPRAAALLALRVCRCTLNLRCREAYRGHGRGCPPRPPQPLPRAKVSPK